MWKILFLAFLAVVNAGYYEELTARQVPEIMKQKTTWVAGHNKALAGKSKEQLHRLAGTKLDKIHNAPWVFPQSAGAIPDTFDARTQWPQCPLIAFIRDQADCGSCWAVSTSSATGDRDCIATNGADQLYLSDEDTMTCCSFCGSGCDGGYPLMAWRYWTSTGLVTGGPYDSKQGCQPYEIDPTSTIAAKTPACSKTCESGYDNTYDGDKHKGSSYYQVGNGISGMQTELMTNGPIVSAFTVYEDFYNYVSGVYVHKTGGVVGGHAVKVIGWGTESGTDYWLVANSWNASWGINGFFKIIRGPKDPSENGNFESSISAGLFK